MTDEKGEVVLRVVPHITDINANGHIFGGWVLSQMDIAGGIIAARIARGAVAPVAIEGMTFIAPILLGDIVSVCSPSALWMKITGRVRCPLPDPVKAAPEA